jgi:hypothetical protein
LSINLLKRVSWSRLTGGVLIKYIIMSDNTKEEEILQARMRNIEMDLEMVENSQKRLENNRAQLILKLIDTRETLLSLKEQDE